MLMVKYNHISICNLNLLYLTILLTLIFNCFIDLFLEDAILFILVSPLIFQYYNFEK